MPGSGQRKIGNRICQRLSEVRSTQASSMAEFAIALPLLVVLIVGIFDFGAAFNLKQELNNAMREGARFGASQPSNDLCLGCSIAPPSVDAVRSLVSSYLLAAKINDCGLSSATGLGGGSLLWIYTANGCSAPLKLQVERGDAVQETVDGTQIQVIYTHVKITYPYQWHFNSVIQLLVPGANYGLSSILTEATAVNMD